ncbi:MAG: fibronectin type III domain-containing protein [Pseudomonadota bacterium]
MIVEASAAGSTSLNLAWTAAVSTTASSGLRYEVHLSDKADFTPAAATLRWSGTDVYEARIGGLTAGTRYQMRVLASDPQQASAASNSVAVATATAAGELRTGVSFRALDDAAVLAVEPTRVVLAAGVSAPKPGSYIGSAQGSGYLRQVRAVVAQPGGTTELATVPAALADVVSAGSVASSMGFPAPEAGGQRLIGPRKRVLAAGVAGTASVETAWPGRRVVLATDAAADPTSFSFNGALQLTDTVTLAFEPRLQAELSMGVTGLDSASVVLVGTASLTQQIAVQANGTVSLDETVKLIKGRSITSVHFIGPVPVVYTGEFSADLRLEAQANAAVRGTTTATMTLTDLRIGFDYKDGGWVQHTSAGLTQRFDVQGSGDATLQVKATLIPKVRLTLNGVLTGQMAFTPSMRAGLGVHGEASAMASTTARSWGADYWLTEGSLRGGMDLYLMADFSAKQRQLAVWPDDAKFDDLSTQRPLVLVPDTAITGLPQLQAVADYAARHPDHPSAVRIQRGHSEVRNPLHPRMGPSVFLTFQEWTDVLVEDPEQQDAFIVRPPPAGADPQDLWLEFAQPGTHKVRLGAYSSLGTVARQIVELEVESRQDVVWSGLSVTSAVQRTYEDGSRIYRVDILGRIKGPKGTEMGVAPYYGYRNDGSFSGLPVSRNCGAWTLWSGSESSGMGCRRGPNDPEETQFSVSGHHWVRDAAGRDTVTFQAGCASQAVANGNVSCPVLGVRYNGALVQQAIILRW